MCSTLPSLAVKVGIYFSANDAGQKYLINQVLPFYKEIVPNLKLFKKDLKSNATKLKIHDHNEEPNPINEAKLHAMISPNLVAWGQTVYHQVIMGHLSVPSRMNVILIEYL